MARGDFRAARSALQESLKLSGGSRDWFLVTISERLVAISEWRIGIEEDARRWFEQAAGWMDENDPNNEEQVEACAEAEKTIGLKEGANETSD